MKNVTMMKRLVCLWALAAGAPILAGTLIVVGEEASNKVSPPGLAITTGAVDATPPVVSVVVPVPVEAFEIEKAKRVDEQLRAYGKRSGWELVWQAPEYVLDQNMTIPGNFENAVAFLLRGANEAGTRLRAVFYRGNKTVRITEF